jgi:hypothetical protein
MRLQDFLINPLKGTLIGVSVSILALGLYHGEYTITYIKIFILFWGYMGFVMGIVYNHRLDGPGAKE